MSDSVNITISAVGTQGPPGADGADGAGLEAIANNTVLANTSGSSAIPIATSVSTMRTLLSISNVDNTSDASKPVSTATQTALDLKANLASPTFTGTPAAPTASYGTNTTQVATTAYVRTEVDTRLGELQSAYKYRSARVSTTANLNLSTWNSFLDNPLNGVNLAVGDNVLVKHQSTAAQNGLYTVQPSGLLARSEYGNAWNEYPGSLVSVSEGTTYADTRWFCTSNDGGTLGSTAIDYVQDTAGDGDALTTNTLDQFADVTQTSGATLAISASTTLNGGTHSGTNTGDQDLSAYLTQPIVMPATSMGALAINVAKYVNTKSISADSTFTFSNATPASGTRTELRITTDATARTATIPSCYSYARNATITSVVVPASSTMSLAFEYTGSRWEIYGDPVATSGTVGKYVLLDDSTPPTDGQVPKWNNAASKWVPSADNNSGGGGTVLVKTQDFRLTTETGVSVATSDRTSQSTLYLTPHVGNQIAIYDGSAWQLRSSAEVSLALSGLTANNNYDVFAYWTGSAVALELSAAWTSATIRAEPIVRQDGVLCKSGALTRRYVGTIRTTGTTTTEDSKLKRFVWNVDNQVATALFVSDETDHTYSSTTYQYVNASNANKIEYVIGLAQSVSWSVSANLQDFVDLGLSPEWTSGAPSASTTPTVYWTSTNQNVPAQFTAPVQPGYHFFALIEAVFAGTKTIYFASGSATIHA